MPHVPDPSVDPKTERDPEDGDVLSEDEKKKRDRMMDKTLADSYPASDPPSSIPNPGDDEEAA